MFEASVFKILDLYDSVHGSEGAPLVVSEECTFLSPHRKKHEYSVAKNINKRTWKAGISGRQKLLVDDG